MKRCYIVVTIVSMLILCGGTVQAEDAAAVPAAAPTTRPRSETIGVRISKLTRNADGTILAVFDTKDKAGNTIPREVLFTSDTIVNYGGQMKKTSDIQDEWI